MASIYKPNDAKIRRIQASTHYPNNGNAYKMKPDSHGECSERELQSFSAFKLHQLILVITSHFACICIGSLILNFGARNRTCFFCLTFSQNHFSSINHQINLQSARNCY